MRVTVITISISWADGDTDGGLLYMRYSIIVKKLNL
ncbi:MAG: hypothetical protein JWR87_3378 [Segetibacter sp.]|nr:hypothetical protein [Segetibacter sp.]